MWIMKKYKYTIQGLTALLIAGGIFYFSPNLLYLLDPTAGSFDLGYIQRPIVAAVYFLVGTFLAWLSLQIDWPDLNKYADDDSGFAKDFNKLTGVRKVLLTTGVFVILLIAYLVCLALVPA